MVMMIEDEDEMTLSEEVHEEDEEIDSVNE